MAHKQRSRIKQHHSSAESASDEDNGDEHKKRRVSMKSSGDECDQEKEDLKKENKHLKAEIKRLERELKESQEKNYTEAQDAADYKHAIKELKNGTDIEGVFSGLDRRLDEEFNTVSTFRYPSQLVRMSHIVLSESQGWGNKTDLDILTKEDLVERGISLFTRGLNSVLQW